MTLNRNNIKLSFDKDNVQFFVNEKKQIVTCVIYAFMDTPYGLDACVSLPAMRVKGFGTAQCGSDDVFDVERGKRIAFARAENDAYFNAVSILNKSYKELLVTVKAVEDFAVKAKTHAEHNKDYVKSLSDSTHPFYKAEVFEIKFGYTNGKPNWDEDEDDTLKD